MKYSATERVSTDPLSSDGSRNFGKNIDSDRPDDEESRSIVRVPMV